jgi:hypothetical protein
VRRVLGRAALLALVAAPLLAGCGSSAPQSPDAVFEHLMVKEFGQASVDRMNMADLRAYGRGACRVLADSDSSREVTDAIANSGFDENVQASMAKTVGLAVVAYCPDQQPKLG